MEKPSPQFVSRLEKELRMAYRAEYAGDQVKSSWFSRLPRFFVPVFSGVMLAAIFVLNNQGNFTAGVKTDLPQQSGLSSQTSTNPGGLEDRFVVFNEGTDEEQFLKAFENEDLETIDNTARDVTEANF